MPILTTLLLGGAAGALLGGIKARMNKSKSFSLHTAQRLQRSQQLLAHKKSALKPAITMSAAEAEAAQQQKIALGAAGLLGIGSLISPVIGWLGLPMLLYNYVYMMRKIHQSYLKKSRLTVVIFDALSVSFTLFLGFFFTTAVLFAALFTTSRLIAKTEREAQTDFSRIFGELSETVWRLQDGIEIEVALDRLQIDDIIIVRAGDMIPIDGSVVMGEGMVDQHLLTGEAQPVEKKVGDAVLTSTLLISGHLQLQVEKQGAETITGQIAQTLEHAATFKHQVQSRGDQIVEKGALRTMVASAIALPMIGVTHAIALSYSGFGYQMRMAAPLTVLNYLRIASRNGIFIKDGRALDTLQHIDTVVFDKTGTLTEEVPSIQHVIACDGFSENQVLQYAASAEQRQKHPIAQAICNVAKQRGVDLLELVNTEYAIGHGLHVELQHNHSVQRIMIGSERFMRNSGIPIPESITNVQAEAGEKGYSIVYIASEDAVLMGAIELRPTLRPDAFEAIEALHALGMTLYIISGDQEKPTRYLAQYLGIDHYFAETLPQDKAKHIEDLQSKGRKVCFIGDGINDSVALQKADVSISLHGAATIAQDTAEIVLMTPNLLHLPYLINMANELQQRMNQSEYLNNASGVACVLGIVVFGMGLGGAIALYASGLLVNISSAMIPLLSHPDRRKITHHQQK